MPAKPWLSIVLPVYCGEQWIEATLNSIAADPDPGIEVVIIDSSPTRGTLDLVECYADRLSLSVFERPDLDGCSPKTNFGVESARADHVTWLCQDDLWLPGRTGAVRDWISRHPEAPLHLAPTAIVDVNGKIRGIWRCPLPAGDAPLDRATLCERLIVQNFVAVASPVVRRDAWLASGGIDVDLWYTGDWDLWLKLSQLGDVYYHDAVTAAFRIHGQSATSTGSRDPGNFIAQLRTVVDRHMAIVRPERAAMIRRLADTSITVNSELAASANGQSGALGRALRSVLRLGPIDALRYLHFSRILERALPRLKARMSGGF